MGVSSEISWQNRAAQSRPAYATKRRATAGIIKRNPPRYSGSASAPRAFAAERSLLWRQSRSLKAFRPASSSRIHPSKVTLEKRRALFRFVENSRLAVLRSVLDLKATILRRIHSHSKKANEASILPPFQRATCVLFVQHIPKNGWNRTISRRSFVA